MINIALVNWRNYLGAGDRYVHGLAAGIDRNMLEESYKLHILTEDDLPAGAEGWWNKIALFRPGAFPAGERVLYLDLDTVIVGPLDDLARCAAPVAAISDFYHPERLASGVMIWTAGECDHVWAQWDQAGKPQFHPRGDQGWIERMLPDAQRLDKLLPGQIVSFKKDCLEGTPEDARLVCFHGLPRPHTIADLMVKW